MKSDYDTDFYEWTQHQSSETVLPLEIFPETCPWTAEQVLDETFWPEA